MDTIENSPVRRAPDVSLGRPAPQRTGTARAEGRTRPLEVLMVEDSENDAMLLRIELERAGYCPHCARVETSAALIEAFQRQPWDVVIADYVMPRFNGLAALALTRQRGLDLPFIIVSGHITDDTAVAAMKAGAHDYVMKDNLARLGPAVERELREAEVRRERRRAEEKLKTESAFRQAVERSVPSGITAVDLEGRQTYVNPAFCKLVGWTEEELVGAGPPFKYWPPEDLEAIGNTLAAVAEGNGPPGGIELRFRHRNNRRIDVLLQITPLTDSFGNVSGWVSSVSDITERKRAEVRLAAEHAITRILTNAPSLPEAAPSILGVLRESLDMTLGTLWMIGRGEQILRAVASEYESSSAKSREFAEASQQRGFTIDCGLPGRIWRERRPLCSRDLTEEPGLARGEWCARAGFVSALALPIQSADEFFGVLEFFSERRLEPAPVLLNMMAAIGSEIGQFIHRRAAEEALRRAHDELEIRVQQRTADLQLAHTRLKAAVAERQRLEHELLEITDKERRRIGLELHDDLGQTLSGIALMTKGLELRLAKQHEGAAEDAAKIHSLVEQTITRTRGVAQDLATLELRETDLPSALANLAGRARELFGISCRLKSSGSIPPMDSNAVGQLYRIAREAVTNAIKHGHAQRVTIELTCVPERITLRIQNDGLPFPALESGLTGMGLRIMHYRAHLIGAELQVKGLGGRGTLVSCSMPLSGGY
jgi:PAS domain S-box-containing protein